MNKQVNKPTSTVLAESRVVSVLTLDLSEQGNYETLAAMGVVLVVIVTLVVGIGMKLAGRDFMLRRS